MAGNVVVNPGLAADVQSAVPTSDECDQYKIGILNCQSAVNKTALIHDLIYDRQLDALFLTETWFNDDTPSADINKVAPPDYKVLHVPRALTSGGLYRGGGLAVVYHQSAVVQHHPFTDDAEQHRQPPKCEMQLVRLGLPPRTHAVIHVYRPRRMSLVKEFVDELSQVITVLNENKDCDDNILLCGDVNCSGNNKSLLDSHLEKALEELNLTQFVNSPTHGNNLLDILASSDSSLVSTVTVDDAGRISDHRLITANITTGKHFNSCRLPKPTSNWLSKEAVAAKSERSRLESQWLKTNNHRDFMVYRRACQYANEQIKKSYNEHLKKQQPHKR